MKEEWDFYSRQSFEEILKYSPQFPCHDDRCLVRSTCFDTNQDNEDQRLRVTIDESCEKGRSWIIRAWGRDQIIKLINSLPKSFTMKHMARLIELTQSSHFKQNRVQNAQAEGMTIAKKIDYKQISKLHSRNLAYLFTFLITLDDQDMDEFIKPLCKKHLN